MKYLALLASTCASTALARPQPLARNQVQNALFTIEVAPGETKKISEAERWEIATSGSNFFDISETHDSPLAITRGPAYPAKLLFFSQDVGRRLLPRLSWDAIKTHLERFSAFPTRFLKTQAGADAAQWLLDEVQDVIEKSGTSGVTASAFTHASFAQISVIARVPGKSNRTVVVGAHLDSVNIEDPTRGRSPGADDNGSGSMLLIEALRVLLTDEAVAGKNATLQNTIEFHWYAAEEGGLRGSQDVFTQYQRAGRHVWAMLQQDMVGYTKGTLDAGKEESFGLVADFTDPVLNEFVARVIEHYTDIPYVNTTCSYACSDHGSAMRSGYPASFVFESEFEYHNPYVHTADDTLDHIDPHHVLQHGRLVLGYLYELGFSKV